MSTSVSNVVSHFPTAQNGFTTTTAGSVSSGATTVTLNSVAGYTNGEPVVLVIDPTDATKKQTFTGIIDTSGVQVTSVVWTAGSNTTHALGATVVDYATATHIAMMSKGIKVNHTQKGNHKTLTDDNANEWVGQTSTASAVNYADIANSASGNPPVISAKGDDATVHLNLRGKGLAKTVTIGAGAATIFPYDYVASGCVITADAAGSTRLATMTAGVVVINGNPVTVAASTSRTYTASKDVYVDVLDNGDGTGLLVFTDNTTNAASPALAANSVRLGIVVVGATNIATAASINQGQEDRVLPIASSIPYSVTESLGNLICPRDPNRKILGYRQITSNFTSTTGGSMVDVTGLNATVNIPTGRKVKVTFKPRFVASTQAAGLAVDAAINDATATAQIASDDFTTPVSAYAEALAPSIIYTAPSSGVRTFKAQAQQVTGGATLTVAATSTAPASLTIELV